MVRLDAGAIDVTTAAGHLGAGARQVRRLLARFRREGMAAGEAYFLDARPL